MKQDNFRSELEHRPDYSAFFKTINFNGEYFLMGMLVEVRYIIYWKKIDNVQLNSLATEINSVVQMLQCPKEIIIYFDKDDKFFTQTNLQSFQEMPKSSQFNSFFSRNLRTICGYITQGKSTVNNIKDYFNDYPNRNLCRKTPQYWLNFILTLNDENTLLVNESKNLNLVPVKQEKIKNKKSVAVGEFIKEDFHLEKFPNYSFSQIEMFIRNDFDNNVQNFIIFLQEKIKDKLSNAETEPQTLYHILIYTYLNYNKTVESLYVSQNTLTAVKKQSEDLERRNKELQSQIDILVKEAEKQKEIRLSKEAKKEAKKKSKKQQRKDYISYEQFEIILNSLETKTLVDHRKKYALILLYATGLRVSNLLLLKRSNVSDLLSKGSTRLNIIKNGDCQRLIPISKKSQQLLEQHATSFYQITATKRDTDLVFTSFNGSNKSIHRSNFTKELNLLLKPFNQKFNMNFKTHSFRITFITNLINVASLHVAKDIVGHKVVASTEIYYRSSLTVEESKKILNKADEQAYKKDDLKIQNGN